MLGTLSGWPPCLLCLPMRACAQPGLAVRAVSAIGAHLELAGRLGMVGLGILRSPAAVHALGLRAEGHLLAVHAPRSKDGGVVWVSSQRKLAEYRAAVPQLRQGSLAGGSACAVEALPSSQTAEQPASRAAAVRDEQPPRAVSATVFGGKTRTKKRIFGKRLRVR